MSRINTNVQSLIAQRNLSQNNRTLGTSLERLSTGLRINRGADDPAGLIASENLRAEKTAIGSAISNAERAQQVANIAEGGLQEISGLLNDLEGLVTTTANDAGLSDSEKEANQLQVDSILQTIDRVAGATNFQGNNLLNGSLDFAVDSVDSEVSDFQVNGAKLGFGDTRDVSVLVTNSAQVGGFILSFGGANIDLGSAGETFTIEVAGAEGSRELSFSSGTSVDDIADTINTFTDVTGVTASSDGGGRLDVTSDKEGSDEFVSITVVDDGAIAAGDGIFGLSATDTSVASTTASADATLFSAATNALKDSGQDVEATINGITAVTKGTEASINTDFLSVEVDLTTGAAAANAQNLGSIDAFTITGGGADFQLAPNVDIAGKVSLGIGNVASRSIGRAEDSDGDKFNLADLGAGKALNLEDGDLTTAQKAVRSAIDDVSTLRGRLGSFQQNTVGATIRSLGVSLENTTAAESAIRDTDFAKESAQLTRGQILVSAATSALSIANSQPQNVLQLLG